MDSQYTKKSKDLLIVRTSQHSLLSVNKGAGDENYIHYNSLPQMTPKAMMSLGSSPASPHVKIIDVVPVEEFSFYALSPREQKLILFKKRIEKCKNPDWARVVCDLCNLPVSKKLMRLSCLSPYCNCSECIKARIIIMKNHLRSYGIKTERFYHFSINFIPMPGLYDELRSVMDSTAREFINKLRKLVPQAYFIMVRDINKSKDGLRVHYHIISFGWKGIRIPGIPVQLVYKTLSEGVRKLLNTQLIGYRDKENLFDYFSKRAVGVFGHKSEGTNFLYSDIMGEQEYLDVFYGKRKIWYYLKNLRVRRTELIKLLNEVPNNCPICNHDHYHLINKKTYKPPPDTYYKIGQEFIRTNEYIPELELYKYCDSCHGFIPVRDWNYEHGFCRLCSKPLTPEGKKEIRDAELKEYFKKSESLDHSQGLSPCQRGVFHLIK